MSFTKMVVIKTDGHHTNPPMAQAQGQKYLINVANNVGIYRESNIKQCLNQAFNGDGKATGAYTFNGFPVLHASAGNGQESVSIFFYDNVGTMYVFAMGEHQADRKTKKNGYAVTIYGPLTGAFRNGAKISLP